MGKVLVIRGGALGDFILTLPAIGLLKHGLPDARVDVLGYPSIAQLAIAGGYADAVRPIEHGPLAGFFAAGGDLDEDWCEHIAGFDVVVSYLYDPQGVFRDNLERAGVETLIEGIAKVDPATGEHAARQLARPLESLALYLDDPAPRLALGGRGEAVGRVAIHPGSGGAAKNWSLERWIRLGIELDQPLLLVSGEAEVDTVAEVVQAWRAAGLDFLQADSWPLAELAGALGESRLFLGHDSGVSHLAAATGTECVLLFGPTDPAVWAPANASVEVIKSSTGEMAGIGYDEMAALARRK